MSNLRFDPSAINLARFSTFLCCINSRKLFTVGFLCNRFNGKSFSISSYARQEKIKWIFYPPPPDIVVDERSGYNLHLLHVSSFTPNRIQTIASRNLLTVRYDRQLTNCDVCLKPL